MRSTNRYHVQSCILALLTIGPARADEIATAASDSTTAASQPAIGTVAPASAATTPAAAATAATAERTDRSPDTNRVPDDQIISDPCNPVRVSGTQILTLPVETVREAVAITSGVVIQGSEMHVRGPCRSNEVAVRISGVPVDDPTATSPDLLDLEVTLEPASAPLLLGDRIRLTITIRNQGSQSVQLPENLTPSLLGLRITRNGHEVAALAAAADGWSPSVALQPGATRVYRLVLDRSIGVFGVQGRYEIAIATLGQSPLREPHARCTVVVQ